MLFVVLADKCIVSFHEKAPRLLFGIVVYLIYIYLAVLSLFFWEEMVMFKPFFFPNIE
jgi:hypothetical protein